MAKQGSCSFRSPWPNEPVSEPEVLPVLFESKPYSPYREYDIYAGQLARTFSLNVDTLYSAASALLSRRTPDALNPNPPMDTD